MMSDTSLDIWQRKAKAQEPKRQNKVVVAFKKYPDHTTAEIAIILRVPVHTISGAPARLAVKGLTKRMGKRICGVTGNPAYTWRAV